jgi:glutathione S-transferase
MLELFQTEWCPASQRVRQRLTEVGVDYVLRQVPVEKADRVTLLDAAGTDAIPTLVLDDGSAVAGEEAIAAWLAAHVRETPEAHAHSQKAARARRRRLEEECECLQAPTPTR